MNNCLVTKLKSVVNNPNLPMIGTLNIKVSPSQYITSGLQQYINFGFNGGKSITIKVDGEGYFADSLAGLDNPSERITSYTLDGPSSELQVEKSFYFKNDSYNISISGKYDALYRLQFGMTPFSIFECTFDDFHYCETLGALTLNSNINGKSRGNVKDINNLNLEHLDLLYCTDNVEEINLSDISTLTNLKSLTLPPSPTKGDISSLSSLINLEALNMYSNSIISGSINSLANLTKMSSIHFGSDTNITGDLATGCGAWTRAMSLNFTNTAITGSIESFVAAQVNNGRNSAQNIDFYMCLSYINFGGQTRPDEIKDSYLFWESASKIYIYTGAQGYSNCPRVYTKGYTQSEAESAFPGKTIIRVDA